jgi:hypothetical protein
MRAIARTLFVLALVAPASVGATGARPVVELTAWPAHATIEGSGKASIRVRNSGSRRVVVDVRRAGFSLDLRGRPKIVRAGKRTADSWIRVRPRQFALRPGGSTTLAVAARVPRHVEPGDHDALVLLTTRPPHRAGLGVRMRLGVVVDVRAPGRVVRRLVLRGLGIRRSGRLRTFELLLINRGNVTEQLARDRVTLSLRKDGEVLASLRAVPRELLPVSRGVVQFRYRGRARGWVSALAELSTGAGSAVVYRTYRIRL